MCAEVKNNNYDIASLRADSNINNSINNSVEKEILVINQLNAELNKLRNEIKSKDKIIEMLNNKDRNATLRENSASNRVIHNNGKGDFRVTLNNSVEEIVDNFTEIERNNDGEFIEVKRKVGTKKRNARTITILGDSIVKDIKPHKMKGKMANMEKLYVKSFPGATVEDMTDYARPTARREPDLIVLHTGSNDLRSAKKPEDIASEIMKLAIDLKRENNEVMVSSITFRGDVKKLNEKGEKVNKLLKEECELYSLFYIDHSNINEKHLNGSKLHLNYKGTLTLAGNFLASIKI